MDKKLQPPPFPIGAKVQYIGERSMWADTQGRIPLLKKGMIFIITELRQPERGLGIIGKNEDGEEIHIQDRHGYSVYVNTRNDNRIIHAKDKHEWKMLD